MLRLVRQALTEAGYAVVEAGYPDEVAVLIRPEKPRRDHRVGERLVALTATRYELLRILSSEKSSLTSSH